MAVPGEPRDTTKYAMKIFSHAGESAQCSVVKVNFFREVKAMEAISGPHSSELLEARPWAMLMKADGTQLPISFILQELVPNGELFDYVTSGGPLNESICRYYATQLLNYIIRI